jgi:hypothetical protein
MNTHTSGNAVPNIDGTELGGVLEDLADIHPGIDLIRDGIRLLAHDRHTLPGTQLLLATLAGSPDALDIVGAIGLLIARLTDPDTNPTLRSLPLDQQKEAARNGWLAQHALSDPDLRGPAAAANSHLDA